MSLSSQEYAALAYDAYQKPDKVGPTSPIVDIGGIPCRRLDYVDKPSGYQGVIYERADTGEMVVVHRGSEFDRQPILDGALADGGMVATRHNAQVADAIEYTQRALNSAKRSMSVPANQRPMLRLQATRSAAIWRKLLLITSISRARPSTPTVR